MRYVLFLSPTASIMAPFERVKVKIDAHKESISHIADLSTWPPSNRKDSWVCLPLWYLIKHRTMRTRRHFPLSAAIYRNSYMDFYCFQLIVYDILCILFDGYKAIKFRKHPKKKRENPLTIYIWRTRTQRMAWMPTTSHWIPCACCRWIFKIHARRTVANRQGVLPAQAHHTQWMRV